MGIRLKRLNEDMNITTYQKKCGLGISGLQFIAQDRKIRLQIIFTPSMNRWAIYMWGQKFIGAGHDGFVDACRSAAEFTLNTLDNEAKKAKDTEK